MPFFKFFRRRLCEAKSQACLKLPLSFKQIRYQKDQISKRSYIKKIRYQKDQISKNQISKNQISKRSDIKKIRYQEYHYKHDRKEVGDDHAGPTFLEVGRNCNYFLAELFLINHPDVLAITRGQLMEWDCRLIRENEFDAQQDTHLYFGTNPHMQDDDLAQTLGLHCQSALPYPTKNLSSKSTYWPAIMGHCAEQTKHPKCNFEFFV